MAYLVSENRRRAELIEKSKPVTQKVREVVKTVTDKTEPTIHFLLLWTAVFWYYFFSGLHMLIWRKLPNGWKRLRKQEVVSIIGNLDDFQPHRKESRKYGRVVDIDYPKNTTDLTL